MSFQRIQSILMRALQGRSIYLAYEDAPPNCSKKINEMLAELYVGGRDKSNRRLPTQFSGRLSLRDPTGGVPEVWRFRQILSCFIKITKKV